MARTQGDLLGILEDGLLITDSASALDFTGITGITVDSEGIVTVPLGSIGGGGHVIQNNGSDLTERTNLNFATGLTAIDDAGNDASVVALDIPSLTDLTTPIVDTDTFALYNLSAAAHEEPTMAQLTTYMEGSLAPTFSGTLNEVSILSDDASKSTYDTTTGIPVVWSGVDPVYEIKTTGDGNSTKISRVSANAVARRQNTTLGLGGGTTYGAELNGSNEYLEAADSDDLSFGDGSTDSPFSGYCWLDMDSANNLIIMGKYDTNREWSFRMIGNNFTFFCYDNSAGAYIGRQDNTGITGYQNEWILLSFSYDGSSTSAGIKIYINGRQVDNTNYSSGSYTAMENTDAPFRIGRVLTLYGNGTYDEPGIVNKELSAQEMVELYNNGSPRDITTVSFSDDYISAWRLGDDPLDSFTGTLVDVVGSNDLSLVNMNASNKVEGAGGYTNSSGSSDSLTDIWMSRDAITAGTSAYIQVGDDSAQFGVKYDARYSLLKGSSETEIWGMDDSDNMFLGENILRQTTWNVDNSGHLSTTVNGINKMDAGSGHYFYVGGGLEMLITNSYMFVNVTRGAQLRLGSVSALNCAFSFNGTPNTGMVSLATDEISLVNNGTERLHLNASGLLDLSAYGSGSVTGTPTYGLSVDSSGNVIETALTGVTTSTVTSTSATAVVDTVILVDDDTAGSTVTITLPAAASSENKQITIKKLGTTANVVIDGNASETIDGATTSTLTIQYESITVICDGSNWHII